MLTAINSLPYPTEPITRIKTSGSLPRRLSIQNKTIHHFLADAVPPTPAIDFTKNQLKEPLISTNWH